MTSFYDNVTYSKVNHGSRESKVSEFGDSNAFTISKLSGNVRSKCLPNSANGFFIESCLPKLPLCLK